MPARPHPPSHELPPQNAGSPAPDLLSPRMLLVAQARTAVHGCNSIRWFSGSSSSAVACDACRRAPGVPDWIPAHGANAVVPSNRRRSLPASN
eukprot:4137219-Prymnesium_polylepis.1